MSKPIDQSNCLLQLSSEGQIVQTDVRCMEKCVWTKDTGLSTDSNFEYLKIEVPVNKKQNNERYLTLLKAYFLPMFTSYFF